MISFTQITKSQKLQSSITHRTLYKIETFASFQNYLQNYRIQRSSTQSFS